VTVTAMIRGRRLRGDGRGACTSRGSQAKKKKNQSREE